MPEMHVPFVRASRSFIRGCLPFAPSFVRTYVERQTFGRRLRNRVLAVPPDEYRAHLAGGLEVLQERIGESKRLGDYLEFGVYNGTSLLAACRQTAAMNLSHMRLFGFDSFEGLPQ